MIFVVRSLSAICLFAFIGRASLWLDPASNSLLVLGYRLFLIFSPLLSTLAGGHGATLAFMLGALGCGLWILGSVPAAIAGALLVGLGLGVGGFLIKAQAAESPKGAAYNKIALNVGSLVSGLVLTLPGTTPVSFWGAGVATLLLCAALSYRSVKGRTAAPRPSRPATASLRTRLGWAAIGLAIGIKLFGVFAILPQLQLKTTGALPSWYGLMITLNSIVVIVFQLPVIRWLSRDDSTAASTRALALLALGMLVMALSPLFGLTALWPAAAWTVACSLIECAASYLDVSASEDNALLYKEAAVGAGGSAAVALMRALDPAHGPLAVGAVGLAALAGGLLLLTPARSFFTKGEPSCQLSV